MTSSSEVRTTKGTPSIMKPIYERKQDEAKALLSSQQKADRAAEKSAQQSAHKNQTTPLKIAGGYRNKDQHKTAFQADLRASRDFIVPKAPRSPKAATSSTKQGR